MKRLDCSLKVKKDYLQACNIHACFILLRYIGYALRTWYTVYKGGKL